MGVLVVGRGGGGVGGGGVGAWVIVLVQHILLILCGVGFLSALFTFFLGLLCFVASVVLSHLSVVCCVRSPRSVHFPALFSFRVVLPLTFV